MRAEIGRWASGTLTPLPARSRDPASAAWSIRNPSTVGTDADYLAADPAVVEVHLLTQAGVIEDFGQRATDAGIALGGQRSGRTVPGQFENVSAVQDKTLFGLG